MRNCRAADESCPQLGSTPRLLESAGSAYSRFIQFTLDFQALKFFAHLYQFGVTL
jgi:hypothetical protein